tara:strand:- start:788 stop:1240 length:453 start_codon:yes stop_codon:yes gene_type:complete
MIGKLDPEENVMNNSVIASRKSAAVMKGLHDRIKETIVDLGWDCYDNISVEIGGTQVSGIDVGEEYNKKWQSPIGTRKYNKDSFIIIKNQDRRDLTKSQPNPDLKAHHLKTEVATIEVANQKLAIQQDEKSIRAQIKKEDDKKNYDTYSK